MLRRAGEAHRAWRAAYDGHPMWRRPVGLLDLSDACLHCVLVRCGPSMPDGWAWEEERSAAPPQSEMQSEMQPTYAPENALWRRAWRFEAVCTRLRAVGVAAEPVWRDLCERLWAEKVFVPARAQQLLSRRCGRDAFYYAMRDRTRTRIEPEELTGGLWWTRVKLAAGERLVAKDPWHRGEPCRCIRHNADGTTDLEAGIGPRPYPLLYRRGAWRFAAHSSAEQSFVESATRTQDGTTTLQYTAARTVRRHPQTWVSDWSVGLLAGDRADSAFVGRRSR